MNRGGKTALIVILIIALAAGMIGAGYGILVYRNGQIYTQKIQAGDRYLALGDYNNAVLMYQDAIRSDEKDERGYLKLANTYIEQNYLTLAIGTLEEGYEKTKSERIRDMLRIYQEIGSTQSGTKQPYLNTSLLNKINESSYGDYVNRNEVQSVRMNGTAEAIVRLDGTPADLVFMNTSLNPRVIIGSEINAYAFPKEVRFDDLTGMFGVSGMLTMDQIRALEFDDVEIVSSGQDNQLRLVYRGSTLVVPCDPNGSVNTADACVMEPLYSETMQDGTDTPNNALIETLGRVEDAQSGTGIAGAELAFYEGTATDGEPVYTVTTDDSGYYSADLDSGQYRAVITKDGYSDAEKDFYIGSYSSEHQENFVLSEDSSGEIRIVLEWDGGTCDLDSYLEGNGDLMNFYNRQIYTGGETAAFLDRDARSAPGVETTTVYDMKGYYVYHVFDYHLSGTMQTSGAYVTIYAPGQSPEKVYIPSDAGNCWYVCTIDAGKVNVTNYMTEVSSSYRAK